MSLTKLTPLVLVSVFILALVWYVFESKETGVEKLPALTKATTTVTNNVPTNVTEADEIIDLKPREIANGQTLTFDEVTFTIPPNWKAEDVSTDESGFDGFNLYSPDHQSKNEDIVPLGDINTVQKGIKFKVEYKLEEVDASVDDSQDYFETFVAGANNIPNWISQKSYKIDGIPLLASRHGYQNYPQEKDEKLVINGRKEGKNIRIIVMYAADFEQNQQVIESILSTFKF